MIKWMRKNPFSLWRREPRRVLVFLFGAAGLAGLATLGVLFAVPISGGEDAAVHAPSEGAACCPADSEPGGGKAMGAHGAEESAACREAPGEPCTDEHGEAEAGHVDEVHLSPGAIQQYGIVVEPVRAEAVLGTFSAPARVSFNREAMAHVGSPVEGRVLEIRVRLGDWVDAGDVLAVVISPALGEAQREYLQSRSAVLAARASLEAARKSFDRAKELEPVSGMTRTEYEKREGDWKLAEANLLGTESAKKTSEDQLRILGMTAEALQSLIETGEIQPSLTLRAPIAGEVVERDVTLGEIVSSDGHRLFVLADMRTVWVLADVGENQLSGVRRGDRVTIRLGALPGPGIEGQIDHIGAFVDPHTRKTPIRIQVVNTEASFAERQVHALSGADTEEKLAEAKGRPRTLKPGMFGEVVFKVAEPAAESEKSGSVLAVPDSAVLIVEGSPAVFVQAEEENAFVKRAVKTGPTLGGRVPVLSGLQEGDRAVVRGAFVLKAELAKGEMEGESCSGN